MERQVLFGFFLVVVQLILLCPQGEAQYGPPYGEGGWGGGYIPPAFSRSDGRFPSVNCSELVCGLGSCNSSSSSSRNGSSYSYSYSFNYTGSLCTCKRGWIPSFTGNPFLYQYPYYPCVFPNCTLTQNCPSNFTRRPPPDPLNTTALTDPCAWADCWEGKCVAVSAYKYRCECNAGFKNLFNDTSFPCLSDCMLSDECKSMGASFSANSTVQSGGGGSGGEGGAGSGGEGGAGSGGSGGGNKGVAVVPGKLLGLALLVIGVALL